MLQGQEIFVILLVALVVLGPQRLPELARRFGGWTAELRKVGRELRAGLEAEVGDLRELQNEFKAPMKEVTQVMRSTAQDMDEVTKPIKSTGPDPVVGQSPKTLKDDLAETAGTHEQLSDETDDADDLAG